MDDNFVRRLERIKRQENAWVDSVGKSLRCYGTKVHPLVQERLSQHFPLRSMGRTRIGASVHYTERERPMRGNNFIHYILDSFYNQEETAGETTVLDVKISQKTYSGDGMSETMLDEAIATIDSLVSSESQVVELKDFAATRLDPATIMSLTTDFKQSALSEGICRFLEKNGDTIPCDDHVQVNRAGMATCGMTMMTRYYEGRDDNRAFCKDTNLLRGFVGGCLHRLILPVNKRIRAKIHSARILRPGSKDMLNLRIPLAVGTCKTFLIIGDVSNFTGSFANSWLMLFSIALELYSKPFCFQRNLFRLKGRLVSARWCDLVAFYLYVTVGVGCWVDSRNTEAFLPGGFLGVACNITLSLLMLAVILQEACYTISSQVLAQDCQAGGDDFAFAITLEEDQSDAVIETIRQQITDYIGPLKELGVFDLTYDHNGVIDGASFCKKGVIVEREDMILHIRSIPTYPIPECLSPHLQIKKFKEQCKAWYTLDQTLRKFEEEHNVDTKLGDHLRCHFLGRYPLVTAQRVRVHRMWLNKEKLLLIEGTYLTRAANHLVNQVREVMVFGHQAFVTFHSRLSQAMSSGLIISKSIEWDGENIIAFFHHSGEHHLYSTETSVVRTFPQPSIEYRKLFNT